MIDKAICLCIDKRIHFRNLLQKQLNNVNIPIQFFIAGNGKILNEYCYNHIDTNDIPSSWNYGQDEIRKNNYNIYLCHQKMLQIAKKEKLRQVLFLEDDALILPRFSFIIQDILHLLNQTQWDVCLLGYHHPYRETEELQYRIDNQIKIIASKNIGGFHGALLNYTSYDKLIAIPPIQNMDVQAPIYTQLFYSIPQLIFYRNIHSEALCEEKDKKYNNYDYSLLEGINFDEEETI